MLGTFDNPVIICPARVSRDLAVGGMRTQSRRQQVVVGGNPQHQAGS